MGKRKTVFKRVTIRGLVLILLFTISGVTVLANEDNLQKEAMLIEKEQNKDKTDNFEEAYNVDDTIDYKNKVLPTTIDELKAVFSTVQKGSTIDLSKLVITSPQSIIVPVSLTLDGGGQTISNLSVIIKGDAVLTLNNITLIGDTRTTYASEATIKGSGKEGRLIVNANASVIGNGRQSQYFIVSGAGVTKLREVIVLGTIQGGSYSNMVGGSAVKNCYQLTIKNGGKVLGGDTVSVAGSSGTPAAVERVNKVSCIGGVIKGGSDLTVDQRHGSGAAIREVLQAEIQDSQISSGLGDYQSNVIYMRKGANIYTSYLDDVNSTVCKLEITITDIIGIDAKEGSNSGAVIYMAMDRGTVISEENVPIITLNQSKIKAGDVTDEYTSDGILCYSGDNISAKVYLKNGSSVIGGSTTYSDSNIDSVGGVGISGARVFTEGTSFIAGGTAMVGGNAITGTSDGFSELNEGCTVIAGNGTIKNGGHAIEANGMDLQVNGAVLQPGSPGIDPTSEGGSAVYGVGTLTMTSGLLKAASYYTTWIRSLYMSGGTIDCAKGYLSVCIITAASESILNSPDVQITGGTIGKRNHNGTDYLAINGGYVGYIAENADGLWSMPRWQEGYTARAVSVICDRTNITGTLEDGVVSSRNARNNKVESDSILCLDNEMVTVDFGRDIQEDDEVIFYARNWNKVDGPWEKITIAYTDLQNGRIQFTQPSRSIQVILKRIGVTVSFNSQGGSEVSMLDNVPKGTLIPKPEIPVYKNYKFDGWYKEMDCINPWNFDIDMVKQDITLYAKWIIWPETKNNQITGMKTGNHILTLRYEQQLYHSGKWEGTGEEDSKQLSFVLKEKEVSDNENIDSSGTDSDIESIPINKENSNQNSEGMIETRDTETSLVIPIIEMLVSFVGVVIILKQKKLS